MDMKFFRPDGSSVNYGTSKTTVYEFSEEKESPDEGGFFVPGQFRITAYDHSSAAINRCGDTSLKLMFEMAPGCGWGYLYDIKGPFGLYTSNSLWSTCSSIASGTSGHADYYHQGQKALQKAMSKVGQSALTLGVELGELRETLEMLRDPLSGLRKLIAPNGTYGRQLRKAFGLLPRGATARAGCRYSNNDVKQLVKNSTGAWLEMRYAVRPFISLVQDIIEEVNQKHSLDFDPTRIRTAKSAVNSNFEVKDDGMATILGVVKGRFQRVVKATVRSRGCVYYTMEYERTKAQYYGLSPEYIPEILWELTRLSFVLDWAFSVGTWLGSYRVKPGISILGNTVSHRSRIAGNIVCNDLQKVYTDHILIDGSFSVPPGSLKGNYYVRTKDQALPSTPLFLGKDKINLFRTIDSLSLIVQAMLGGKKKTSF
jgi:hypothetical protein